MAIPLLVLHPVKPVFLEPFRAAGFAPYPAWEADAHARADRKIGKELRFVLTSGSRGLTAAEIASYPKLEMVSALGAGYENIDLAAARARGLVVTHSPGANARQVADHAIALVLALLHGIAQADAAVRRGEWDSYRDGALHPTLTGRRLGILGFGRIGREIARRGAAGFDTPIGYTARSRRDDVDHLFLADPITLAEWAEIVVVATPGGAGTRHLVNADFLKALGPNGYVVNIARGSVVDTDALIDALRSNAIAGAALDVIEGEPAVPSALTTLSNVVLTPHLGGHSPDAIAATVELVIQNLTAHLEGRPVLTPVPGTADNVSRPA